MIKDLSFQKLKKAINPKRFRFVVILYNTTKEIETIKAFLQNQHPQTHHETLDLQEKQFSQLAPALYRDNTIVYIDDFAQLLDDKELCNAFNQRRDKIASHAINMILFYPKKLQNRLYKEAIEKIPDLWEFRTAVIEVESEEDNRAIPDKQELPQHYQYSGMNFEEKKREIARLEKRLQEVGDREEEALLLNNLGFMYKEQGLYEKARPLYEKALMIREEVLGERQSSTATSYDNLAALYESAGAYEKALPLLEKALKIREEVLGERHPDTAISYNNLAALYESAGAYEKALPLLEKALKIREEVLGERHPDTAISYNNLAVLYRSMGAYEKALPLLEKALKIREEVLGEYHPDTAASYYNLAGFFYITGDLKQAYRYIQKAVDIWEKVLPVDHPNLINAKESLEIIKQNL